MTWEEQAMLPGQGRAGRVAADRADGVAERGLVGRLDALGTHGPCETVATSCATGTHAIGNAARWIAAGRCDVASPGERRPADRHAHRRLRQHAGAVGHRHLAAVRHPPGRLLRLGAPPCSCSRRAGHAAARGVRAYAEVAGTASSADGHHVTAPSPSGSGAGLMRNALADAGVSPAEITHINAHGTSTPLNDATEAGVIAELFGDVRPAVTSSRG